MTTVLQQMLNLFVQAVHTLFETLYFQISSLAYG